MMCTLREHLKREFEAKPGYEKEFYESLTYSRIGVDMTMLRMRAGLSLVSLAGKLNLSMLDLEKLEDGDSTPDIKLLHKVAGIFNKQLVISLDDKDVSYEQENNND